MSHECAVPGCGSVIVAGLLMCKRHWYQVPLNLRSRVNRTWRGYVSVEREAPPAQKLAALRSYREAREAAIESVQQAIGEEVR